MRIDTTKRRTRRRAERRPHSDQGRRDRPGAGPSTAIPPITRTVSGGRLPGPGPITFNVPVATPSQWSA